MSKIFCQLLRSRGDVEVLGTSDVKTVSGRQIQVESGRLSTFQSPTGANAATSGTNASSRPSAEVEIVPYVSADGETVQLVVIPLYPKTAVDKLAQARSLTNVPDAGTGLSTRLTKTATLQSGQTYACTEHFRADARATADGETNLVLILVTPTILKTTDNVPTSSPGNRK